MTLSTPWKTPCSLYSVTTILQQPEYIAMQLHAYMICYGTVRSTTSLLTCSLTTTVSLAHSISHTHLFLPPVAPLLISPAPFFAHHPNINVAISPTHSCHPQFTCLYVGSCCPLDDTTLPAPPVPAMTYTTYNSTLFLPTSPHRPLLHAVSSP